MTPPPSRRTPSRAKGTAKSNGKAGLSADLLADLNAPGALPTATPPSAVPAGPGPTSGTPALSVTVTPLRWRLPSFASPERGVGVAVRLGPVRVEVAF